MVPRTARTQTGPMPQLPGFLRTDAASQPGPARSLFEIVGALGPTPAHAPEGAPFRAACVLEAARRGRPSGPPRPTPHGAAPPAR